MLIARSILSLCCIGGMSIFFCHSRAGGNLRVSMLSPRRDRKRSNPARTRPFSEAEPRCMHSQAELGNEKP